MQARLYLEDGGEKLVLPEDVSERLVDREGVLWVDVEDPDLSDLARLVEEFEVHRLAADDLTETSGRPRLVRFADHTLLVARDATHDGSSLSVRPVDLVFGDGWMVSVRRTGEDGAKFPVDEVARRFSRRNGTRGATDEGFLLATLLDVLASRYLDVLELLEDRLDRLEEQIFDEERADPPVEELYRLRQSLIGLRRVVAPLAEAVAGVLRPGGEQTMTDVALLHLRDVQDQLVRVVEQIDTERDLLSGALEAHLALVSNRLNQVMRKMTAYGAILVSATLVAGIYGMNFRHMPELDWRLGYPFALALMVALAFGLRARFQRRGWL